MRAAIVVACLVWSLLGSAAEAQTWEYNKELFAAAVPAVGVRVTVGDSVKDGCWTNKDEVLAVVKDQLSARGLKVTETSGEYSYRLHLYGIGHGLKKTDGTRVRCFGNFSYALSSYFYGTLNKATEPLLFLGEIARGSSFMDTVQELDAEILRVAEAAADGIYEKLLADGKVPQ